ncbi:hypothetical protein K9M50_02725 [Patescibacteria group bacterium]|nr:hypothetical protein [Patescibacteria group bacterium]
MKTQQLKSMLLLSLIIMSGLIIIISVISFIIIGATPFQSTTPDNSILEQITKFIFTNPILSLTINIIAILNLIMLSKAFKVFVKRNELKVAKVLEEFFTDK